MRLMALIFIFVFSSCSQLSTRKEINETVPKQEQKIVAKNFTVRPGEAVQINFVINEKSEKSVLKCADKKIPFFERNGLFHAYIAESYFSQMKPILCQIHKNGKAIVVANIIVTDKEFPSEKLNVDQRRVTLNAKDLKRVRKEQVFLNKNYASSPDKPYFRDAFMLPIDAYVTSIYGSKRLFNNSKQSQHLGTDFRAAVGEPIKATNAGKVVVARDLFFTGNTVTIDHGLGIFSIYGHLSKVETVEGEFVPKGTLIGLAGATGRVTGPHLHWGVKVNGHFIEGESLVKTSQTMLESEN